MWTWCSVVHLCPVFMAFIQAFFSIVWTVYIVNSRFCDKNSTRLTPILSRTSESWECCSDESIRMQHTERNITKLREKEKNNMQANPTITLFYTNIYALLVQPAFLFLMFARILSPPLWDSRVFLANRIRNIYFANKAKCNMNNNKTKKNCTNAIKQHLAVVQNNRFKSQQYVLVHQTKRKQGNKWIQASESEKK